MSENKFKKYARPMLNLCSPTGYVSLICQNCQFYDGIYSIECCECREFYSSQFQPRKINSSILDALEESGDIF